MQEKGSMEIWNGRREHGKNCKHISLGNFDKDLAHVCVAESPFSQARIGPSEGQIWVAGFAQREPEKEYLKGARRRRRG
jgi:hypothetical protein